MTRNARELACIAVLATMFSFAGCAAPPVAAGDRLSPEIARADTAYLELKPERVADYNRAVARIATQMEHASAPDVRLQLARAGVSLDLPPAMFPLLRYHVVRPSETTAQQATVGVPILLDYDTKETPLYPPEGMLLPATAVYTRIQGTAASFAAA